MSDKQLILVTGLLGMWVSFLLGFCIADAQEAHVNPQVVFKLDHRDSVGRYVMEAQEVRIAYTIEPLEGDHPAPIAENQLVICRPYNEGPKLYLHCGGYRYAVRNVGLAPKKAKKGEEDVR